VIARFPSSAAAIRRAAPLVAAFAVVWLGCSIAAGASRDVLWRIVSECLDASTPEYCARCFSPIERVCGDRGCAKTVQVWAETPEYVAIRDIKMCGCPAGFVHGLALPRSRITGVEDPRRPAGIWPFAWRAAQTRIADEGQIALVVNPPGLQRTQDQLHVHLVRLAAGAHRQLAARSPARTASLEEVWDVAAASAAARGLADYGVLVARDDTEAGYWVLVEPFSPEGQFTVGLCQ